MHAYVQHQEEEAVNVRRTSPITQSERNALCLVNLPYAKYIALEMWRAGRLRNLGSLEDAIQEASIALMTAIERFDSDHVDEKDGKPNANFESYVGTCIRNHLGHKGRTGTVIVIPGWALRKNTKEKRPDVYKHAKHLCAVGSLSLSSDGLVSREKDPDHDMMIEETRAALERLEPDMRDLLKKRFGIGGEEPQTLRSLGEAAGVSSERIRVRQRDALRSMRIAIEGFDCQN